MATNQTHFRPRRRTRRERARRFLTQNCADDAALRNAIEQMLRVDEQRGETGDADFLAEPLLELRALAAAAPLAENARIGSYRILRELGRGGTGAVYLAERHDFKNKVALKIIKSDFDRGALIRRFEQERRILAGLEHPNIARFLDAGVTDAGAPYFVMEYVEGSDLLDFCAQHNLSINARLQIFRRICNALAYAHSRLVVHRDLKPSNIIVTRAGEPKLLDFGIAKLLAPNGEPNANQTATGYRLMTPVYAAPEQLLGETTTTQSDVYSLSVILFEMLTGKLPFEFKNARLAEIIRQVCETEPIAPSAARRDNAAPANFD